MLQDCNPSPSHRSAMGPSLSLWERGSASCTEVRPHPSAFPGMSGVEGRSALEPST
jgi:hypothetical protein